MKVLKLETISHGRRNKRSNHNGKIPAVSREMLKDVNLNILKALGELDKVSTDTGKGNL